MSADRIILVNGLPGAGKTTLARALAAKLNAALLSKDQIKEALADAVGLDFPNLGAIAMETVWAMAAERTGTIIIDSWWYRPRDLDHARRGLASLSYGSAVEIWCDCPEDVARQRVLTRPRHPVHHDTGTFDAPEPLALTPVIRVDTAHTVDLPALASLIA